MAVMTWAGQAGSYARLQEAVQHNCTCKPDLVCPAHLMLSDQKGLNHMAWLELQAERLRQEESRVQGQQKRGNGWEAKERDVVNHRPGQKESQA